MPSPINAQPNGLLSLLGIKALGQNPSRLPDEVAPTMELSNFYQSAAEIVLSGISSNVTTQGINGVNLTVPPGQLWIVSNFSIARSTALPAATTYRMRPCVYEVGTSLVTDIAEVGGTWNAGDSVGISFGRPLFVKAGFALGIWVETVALGTAVAFTGIARVNAVEI